MRGVEKAKSGNFDLIICDIMMPELDGYGVLHILSKNPKTSLIPFIFLTAKSENVDFRKGMSLGADDCLTKPFEKTDLLDAIELRLKKSKKLQVSGEPEKAQVDQFMENVQEQLSLEDLISDRNIKTFKILSKNVLEHETRLLKLAYGNVRERVAGAIWNLYEKYGGEDNRIELNISREELAGYADIATESLIRTLSDFRSDDLIENDGKHLIIKKETG